MSDDVKKTEEDKSSDEKAESSKAPSTEAKEAKVEAPEETPAESSADNSEAVTEEAKKLSVTEEREQREAAVVKELAEAYELGDPAIFRQQYEFTMAADKLVEFAESIKNDSRFQFIQLTDVTAVDYLKQERDFPERFAVIYSLFSFLHNTRFRLRVWVDEDSPRVPTLSSIFGSADWAEREVYDMFGIEFDDHPNLIRILMPDDFGSHPLRKDYPLRGRGERDDFPRIRRGGKNDL